MGCSAIAQAISRQFATEAAGVGSAVENVALTAFLRVLPPIASHTLIIILSSEAT
jgi:hypothetical protein